AALRVVAGHHAPDRFDCCGHVAYSFTPTRASLRSEWSIPTMPRVTSRRSDRAIYTILGLLAACLFADPSCAQEFPSRPIKLIVGPSPDVSSRIIAEHLQQAWGQPLVVEPRPGGGGKLAAAAVAGAEPDGHTLLFATPTYTLNAAMKLASNDLVKDFE